MRFIMAAGTGDIGGDGTDAREEKTGLSGNHAYSMIDALIFVQE